MGILASVRVSLLPATAHTLLLSVPLLQAPVLQQAAQTSTAAKAAIQRQASRAPTNEGQNGVHPSFMPHFS